MATIFLLSGQPNSKPMTSYGLFGKMKAQPGQSDELISILLKASELASAARGCRIYLVSRDILDCDCICIIEVWDDKVDHDRSLEIPGVKELISQALPLIDGQPEHPLIMNVIGGAGLNFSK
jgi:quinol monooxygenase YgiN